ncbi:MAG: MATE family efflux transporter [Clostridia bacterium]|nr:MATE family efflux transporter [Clostridia bacterium]
MNKLQHYLDTHLTSTQFSYPQLVKMFLTLALDQFFIFLISMLSSAMVSSVGEAAIAAVSMVGTINGMVSLLFTSLATGGGIVVARAKGRGDLASIRQAIGESAGLCFLTALLLASVLYLSAPVIVSTIYPHVEPLLIQYAIRYMRLMAISFLPFSIFNAVFNIFRSLGDTKSSLLLTVVINVTHLFLSMLFINILHLGVDGSGYSYIIARLIGAVLALLWLLVIHNSYALHLFHFFHFSRSVSRDIFVTGMPLVLESFLMQSGMLLVQVYLARLTTTALAAQAVSNSIFSLYSTTSGALSALTATVTGQCFGARNYDLTRRYCQNLIRSGRAVLLITVLVLYPLTPLLLRLYSATPEASAIIRIALGIGAAGMPLLWCDSYLPAFTIRACGDGMYASIVSIVSLFLGRCLLGYLLTIPFGLGVPGIWIGMVTEWLIRGILLHWRLKGTKWLHI